MLFKPGAIAAPFSSPSRMIVRLTIRLPDPPAIVMDHGIDPDYRRSRRAVECRVIKAPLGRGSAK
jgi:hypothetical protein